MLNIGDCARHQITGQIGEVIGYGVYLTTLKVRATNHQGVDNQKKFLEDVYSAWIIAEPTESGVALQA